MIRAAGGSSGVLSGDLSGDPRVSQGSSGFQPVINRINPNPRKSLYMFFSPKEVKNAVRNIVKKSSF